MNVYALRPKSKYGYCGGMALVAAPSFEDAIEEYRLNGVYNEELCFGDFTFRDSEACSAPKKNLEWHGETSIICDHLYFE